MGQIVFTDESGTSGGQTYAIGALSVPEEKTQELDVFVSDAIHMHGIIGEVKWTKLRNSYGLINFGLDLLRYILESRCCFSAIVVKKAAYRKWVHDPESAFYVTYRLLLEHCAKTQNKNLRVTMDRKSDTYAKRHEVVQVIANYRLKHQPAANLATVVREDSKNLLGLQAVDYLTGAICTAHNMRLCQNQNTAPAKRLAIERLAKMLGWDDLIYDTYPNGDFNIWHFPIDFRCDPATLKVHPDLRVPYVTAREFLERTSNQ
ncbi:MAG: DUF3800 domain-containing protein [Nitrososphaera sp.]|nr:DUF3800 domain-containing protein [Nitrososphaera sp.]